MEQFLAFIGLGIGIALVINGWPKINITIHKHYDNDNDKNEKK